MLRDRVLPDALVEIIVAGVMVCPRSKQPLIYFPRGEHDTSEAEAFLVCPASRLRYAISEAGVPAFMAEEATELSAGDVERLIGRAHQLGLRVP